MIKLHHVGVPHKRGGKWFYETQATATSKRLEHGPYDSEIDATRHRCRAACVKQQQTSKENST